MSSTALVIQCFIKADTLHDLCDSLLRCDGTETIDLIFWLDSPLGSRSEARFTPLHAEVCATLDRFVAMHSGRFRSVSRHQNLSNLGTCATCRAALDHAFSLHPFAIFAEDDIIFARDAFAWFGDIRRLGLLDEPRHWAIAGESVFFNARDEVLPEGWPAAMARLAAEEGLTGHYVTHNFIPSTCFATTAAHWRHFGATRGQPLGDVDLCTLCRDEDGWCIFPVVPRVKDLGMLHHNGYSVLIHTRDGVKERKNTYLMSDDLLPCGQPAATALTLYAGHSGRLYTLSTLLKSLPGGQR